MTTGNRLRYCRQFCRFGMILLRSVSGSGSFFSVGFGFGSCFGSYTHFSTILNINFTFVFPSFKCVRLHNMMGYNLFKDFFLERNTFISLTWAFFWEIVKLYQFFWVVLLQAHFAGSEAARIRIRNDFFRILLKVSDPTESGSGYRSGSTAQTVEMTKDGCGDNIHKMA